MANIDTLNEFLRTLNDPAYANHHNVTHLMTLFCADDATLGIPFVGITQRGPQFKLKANIKKLFLQLLTISFHDMAWSPAAPLRLTRRRHDRRRDRRHGDPCAGMVHGLIPVPAALTNRSGCDQQAWRKQKDDGYTRLRGFHFRRPEFNQATCDLYGSLQDDAPAGAGALDLYRASECRPGVNQPGGGER